jgi:hypothetical protein
MEGKNDELARRVSREGDPSGPVATLMTNGIPAKTRLNPPCSVITLIRVASSFQRST